jgi:hypothetical protein
MRNPLTPFAGQVLYGLFFVAVVVAIVIFARGIK